MSPEVNGNPPSVTKRKKNRDKKPQVPPMNPLNFNMSHCNYFPNNPGSFQNLSIPDITTYYSFMNCSNPTEPMSLPIYPMNYSNYYPSNPNFNFMSTPNHPMMPSSNGANGPDYMSLPAETLDPADGEEGRSRRYSDPGFPNESDDDNSNSETPAGDNHQIVEMLKQQIGCLKESNRKLSREVMEMRIELNMLKQQQNSRHLDRGEYEPGMLADIIREVRDAARVREDALLARVKHMIEEKQLNMNHLHLVNEKNRNNDRISKLEEQLKNLSMSSTSLKSVDGADHSSDEGSSTARQVLELEREALELRRELQDTRAKKDEADQKLQQLDKKLSTILRRNDIYTSDVSEDGKTNSMDSISITTTTSSIPQAIPRVTLSGPVTDL